MSELEQENKELKRLVQSAITLVSEDVYRLPEFWMVEAQRVVKTVGAVSQRKGCTDEICRCNGCS